MSKKRSWVWQHFMRVSEDNASCSICDKTLTCADGSTTGLRKHLSTHNIVEETEIVDFEAADEAGMKIESIEDSEYLLEASPNPEEGHKTRKSWVWNYFTRISESAAKCGVCLKVIRSQKSSTSGMAFHLSVHNLNKNDVERLDRSSEEEEFEETFEEPALTSTSILGPTDDSLKSKRSLVWNHFVKLSPLLVRCEICDKEITYNKSSTSGMKAHLRSHKMTQDGSENSFEEQRPTKKFKSSHVAGNKDRSWVWNHFIKVSDSTSRCEICHKLIKCSGASTSGMRNHLKTHNLIEEMHNLTEKTLDIIEQTSDITENIHNEDLIITQVAEESFIESPKKKIPEFKPTESRKQQCHVCDVVVGAFGTPLDTSLELTNIPIKELLESFGLGEATKNFSAICLECLSSLKRYDEFQHQCQVIQNKIADMYHKTHSESVFIVKEELEADHGDESLDENIVIVDTLQSQEFVELESNMQEELCVVATTSKKQECLPITRTNAVYQCDKCNKSYSVRSRMIRHLKSHRTGNKGLPCVKCSKICRSDFHLQTHVITEHNLTPDGPFECPTCFKMFNSKHQLKMHYYLHKPDRNWLCIL